MHSGQHSSPTTIVAPARWSHGAPLAPHERGQPIFARAEPIPRHRADQRVVIALFSAAVALLGVLAAILWLVAARKGSPRS